MKRLGWNIPHVLFALTIGSSAAAQSGESMVPPQRQAPILLKVLSFDYTLPKRVKNTVHIAVTFNDKDAVSSAVADDMYKAFGRLKSLTVHDLPIKVSKLAYGGPGSLKSWIDSKGVNTIYICPGLDSQLKGILQMTRSRKISVLTGVRRYVQQGVIIGVLLQGTKPKIAVNLSSMKAHSLKLSANLLRMATIYR